MTDSTNADGFCTFGNLSYYSITNGASECLPMVYVTLNGTTGTGEPVNFNYIDGACIFESQFNVDSSPVDLPCLLTSVNEIPGKPLFAVSANYPNPFNGSTMVDVTLTKPSDVTIEVNNI